MIKHDLLIGDRDDIMVSITFDCVNDRSNVHIIGDFFFHQVVLNTETYYTTHTFTRTLEGESTPTTSHEVITQVIVTEAPSVMRSSVTLTPTASPMVVTKTYLTTFTYFKTGVTDEVTQVETEMVVSSDVVTETIFITKKQDLNSDVVIKTEAPSFSEFSDDLVFATRTFYTTSTHLTTLLQEGNTVTTSSIEVQSRIVTDTIPASKLLTMQDSLLLDPSVVIEDMPQTEAYVPIEEGVYKRLKTYYATLTHYTTLADGSVNSREVTETNVETSLISSSAVPETLINRPQISDFISSLSVSISPTTVSSDLLDSSGASRRPSLNGSQRQSSSSGLGSTLSRKPDRVSTRGNQGSSLRPSHVRPSSSSRLNPSKASSLKSSSGVTIEPSYGSLSVSSTLDRTAIKATATESVPTSSAIVLLSALEPSLDYSGHSLISTEVLSVPTVLRQANGESTSVGAGHTIAIVEKDGLRTVLPNIPVELTSGSSSHQAADSNQESDSISDSGSAVGSGAAIGLMVPVLSAVAGMIRNNMGAAVVPALAKSDRPESVFDLPRNTLVRVDEPQYIPVGGVGFSINDAQRNFVRPTQGFIPLNRFDEVRPSAQIPFARPVTETTSNGFKPPTTTERGFTAIFTTGTAEIPTRVSVISGVQTILFNNGVPEPLPPPGLPPPPGGEFQLVQSSLDELNDMIGPAADQSQLSDLEFGTEFLPFSGNTEINESPSLIADSSGFITTITSLASDGFIFQTEIPEDMSAQVYSKVIHTPEVILQSTVGIGSALNRNNFNTPLVVDNKETIVVNGVSTVMSGATTIFGSLFTRPSNTEIIADQFTSVTFGSDELVTKYISRVETDASTVTETITDVKFMQGIPSTFTEVVEKTLPQQTVVSTLIGTKTQVSTVKVTSLPPTTVALEEDYITTTDHSYSEDDIPSYVEDEIEESIGSVRNEATLGLAEDNEISRVVESQGPGPQVSIRGPSPVSSCISACSNERNEICKMRLGQPTCVCRPGYARIDSLNICERKYNKKIYILISLFFDLFIPAVKVAELIFFMITASMAYKVRVLLDSISDNQIIFNPILNNLTHPTTQDLSEVTVHGISRAFMDSDMASDFHSVTVTKFEDLELNTLPLSAKDVVSFISM